MPTSLLIVFPLTLFLVTVGGNANDADENIDFVNIKALSELHGNLRSRYREKVTSSGDYGYAESELYLPKEIEPVATTTRSNSIEQFLVRQRVRSEGNTPDKLYDEGVILEPEEDTMPVTYDNYIPQAESMEGEVQLEPDVEAIPEEVTVATVGPVETKMGALPIERVAVEHHVEKNSTTSAIPTPPKSRFATITCFECYGCKTYYLKKIRRCPRHHDMCVKEVSVGRRIAINGRNLIEIEINQYCSTGACPRSDGNVTFACCYSNLCNSAISVALDKLFIVVALVFVAIVRF